MKLWAYCFAVLLTLPALATEWQEGLHYRVVNATGKSEGPSVVEIFSYGCPHCNAMEPVMDHWLGSKPAEIKFYRLPAAGMRADWDLYAKIFFTAQALGIDQKMHKPLFDLIHKEQKGPKTEEDGIAFLQKFGWEDGVVRAAMKSPGVAEKVSNASAYARIFLLKGVPAFVINNRYYTDLRMAAGANPQTGEIPVENRGKEVKMFEALLTELALKQ